MSKIQIKVKSYDPTLVDNTSKKIVEYAKSEKASISGPIPLPTKKEIFTILRSVHVNKTSREQFELRTFKRLIVLDKVSDKLLEGLKRLEVPSGVEIVVNSKK